jgi:GrpB-like predicted nucleotidyltransferase (UPF0157 family)
MATCTYEYIPIILEQHNPQWAVEFEEVKKGLEQILAGIPIITIEHVGSTSIPDLKAKPVLDIDIEINRESLDAVTNALKAAGYTPIGECHIPGRHSFFQPGPTTFSRRGGYYHQGRHSMVSGGEIPMYASLGV